MASIFLAYLSYQYIEKPIRFGAHKTKKTIALIILMLFVGGCGIAIYKLQGLEWRSWSIKNSNQLNWRDYKSDECEKLLHTDSSFCINYGEIADAKIAILGDSTANSLAPGFGDLYGQKGIGVINIGSWACPPISNLNNLILGGKNNNCKEVNNRAYSLILNLDQIELVILGIFARDLQYWSIEESKDLSSKDKFRSIMKLLDKDIKRLTDRGIKVVISFDTPLSPIHARDCVSRPLSNKMRNCTVPLKDLVDRQPYLDMFNEYFLNRTDVCIFRQSETLLQMNNLRYLDEIGNLLIRDTHHLSYKGSELIAKNFIISQCNPFEKD